ncbi:hypothetical protein [Sulfuracidifex tepidarius]|uniref:Uncharacterized protein n=1 Tax=Sulfuracidifex tepidarius TaxID=1294262 RepID=A0A510DXJ7_9CREN|nr:hypothetical protein [Sulfuracidifex tepidarius]BBG24951.1 hypothetical protein IC006_2285 [Sulfuracidifex tepidarius]BBG27734.1 hypothetical protein IC007_2288 [Sulfuracidifex tepidarius]
MDSCGCQTERKFASDFLARQVFRLGKRKGKEMGSFEVNGRKFSIYETKEGYKYLCDQCPLLIITLEAVMEEVNKGNKDESQVMERISSIKGLTVNQMIREVVVKVMECLRE